MCFEPFSVRAVVGLNGLRVPELNSMRAYRPRALGLMLLGDVLFCGVMLSGTCCFSFDGGKRQRMVLGGGTSRHAAELS